MTARPALASTTRRASRRREPIYAEVVEAQLTRDGKIKAVFAAADSREAEILKGRKYKVGDVVRLDISKPRNPKHHRLVLATIAFLVHNTEAFDTIDQALIAIKVGMGYCDPVIDGSTGKTLWILRSISFDRMSEDEFSTFHADLLKFITARYLKGMTPEQLEEAASLMDGGNA